MITYEFVSMMAKYNAWMNEKLYGLCATIGDPERKADRGAFFQSLHGTLDHVLTCDFSFMSAFTRQPRSLPESEKWLFQDFGEMHAARLALDERLCAWAPTVTEAWLGEPVKFTSEVDGQPRQVIRAMFVVHMFNHQTHHRGQLTTLLSQMGHDPGVTDLHGSF